MRRPHADTPAPPGEPSEEAGEDLPVIVVSEDRQGVVFEVDASQWAPGVLAAAVDEQLGSAAGPVSLWVDHPDDALTGQLAQWGFVFGRDLHRMERDLPMDAPSRVRTRAFVVGRDEQAWVEVNNRAFSWHREQGGWTVEMVAERRAEPWFDPEGFRIYELDGAIAAYCWTKAHLDEQPPIGEVYAIAVDPAHHGKGLGRALTLAGYEHLYRTGLRRAMLYVDADNVKAVKLYRSLGLRTTVVRRLFTGTGRLRGAPDADSGQ